MPDERGIADFEKFLADERAIDERKQALIADLLKQKETAIKDFDEKLAKLGYDGHGRKRSHHKKGVPAIADSAKPKTKT